MICKTQLSVVYELKPGSMEKVIISHGIYCLEFTNMLSKGLILSSMRKKEKLKFQHTFNIVSLGQVKHFGRSGNREFYFDSLV